MANRVRPRCADCQTVMAPLYAKGPRGKAFVRVKDAFTCPNDGTLARGRRKVKYL
jgi:hypothetical protein